jgi:hypothetical protein
MFKKLIPKIHPVTLILFLILLATHFISFDWGINYGGDLFKQGYESNVLKENWVLASDVGDEHTYNGYMGNAYALENKFKEYKSSNVSKKEFIKECFYALSLEAPFSTIPVAPFVFSVFAFLCSAACVLLGVIDVNPFDFHYIYMLSGRALSIFLSCLIVFPLNSLMNVLFEGNDFYRKNKRISILVLLAIVSVPVFFLHTKWLSYNGPLATLEVFILYKIVMYFRNHDTSVKLKQKLFLGLLLGFALGIKFTVLAAFVVFATGSLLKFFESNKNILMYFKSRHFINAIQVFGFAVLTYFIIIFPAIISGDIFSGVSSQTNMLSGGGGTETSKFSIAASFFLQTLPISLGYLNYLLFIVAFGYVLIKFKETKLSIKLVWVWVLIIISVLFSNKLSLNPTRLITLSILALILVWFFVLNNINKYKKGYWLIKALTAISIISTIYLTINIFQGTKNYTNRIANWTKENLPEKSSVVLKTTFSHEQHIPIFMYENNKYMNEDSIKTYQYNFITDWNKMSFNDYKKGKVSAENRFSLTYLSQFKPCYLYISPEINIEGLDNTKPLVSFKPEYYSPPWFVKALQYISFNANFSELYYYNKNVDVYYVE